MSAAELMTPGLNITAECWRRLGPLVMELTDPNLQWEGQTKFPVAAATPDGAAVFTARHSCLPLKPKGCWYYNHDLLTTNEATGFTGHGFAGHESDIIHACPCLHLVGAQVRTEDGTLAFVGLAYRLSAQRLPLSQNTAGHHDSSYGNWMPTTLHVSSDAKHVYVKNIDFGVSIFTWNLRNSLSWVEDFDAGGLSGRAQGWRSWSRGRPRREWEPRGGV